MSTTKLVLTSIWLLSGVAFWIECIRYNGTPDRWKSEGRETGWGEILLFYFPVCALGGLLWWIAKFVNGESFRWKL